MLSMNSDDNEEEEHHGEELRSSICFNEGSNTAPDFIKFGEFLFFCFFLS